MGTRNLEISEKLKYRQWRITIKSAEPVDIDYNEPMGGNWFEAKKRAIAMWKRTSYMVGAPNRDVYVLLEAWDEKTHAYVKVQEYRGRLSENSKAPR